MRDVGVDVDERVRSAFARQAFMRSIGAVMTRVAAGEVAVELVPTEDLTQQHGYVHAGVVTSIADAACGFAAFTLMPHPSEVLSVEFKINLLRPAVGERFVAVGRVVKAGRTLTVTRGDVMAHRGSEENHVATMVATMMRLEPRPGGGTAA